MGGENYILAKLQENLHKTKEVIANICKLKTLRKSLFSFYSAFLEESTGSSSNTPVKRICQQHDEAILTAVAATLELGDLDERDKLLMQRKISKQSRT